MEETVLTLKYRLRSEVVGMNSRELMKNLMARAAYEHIAKMIGTTVKFTNLRIAGPSEPALSTCLFWEKKCKKKEREEVPLHA